jgi:hypothetical protein
MPINTDYTNNISTNKSLSDGDPIITDQDLNAAKEAFKDGYDGKSSQPLLFQPKGFNPFGIFSDSEPRKSTLPLADGNAALMAGDYQGVIDYVDQNPAGNEADQKILNTYKEVALLGIELENASAKGDFGKVATLFESMSNKLEGVSPELADHYSAGADHAHQANTIMSAALLGDHPQAVSVANEFLANMDSTEGQWAGTFDSAVEFAGKVVSISDNYNSGNLAHASKIASDYAAVIPEGHPLKAEFTKIAENIAKESTSTVSNIKTATSDLSSIAEKLANNVDGMDAFKLATDHLATAVENFANDPSKHNLNLLVAAVSELKSSVYSLDGKIDENVFNRAKSFVDGLEIAVNQAMNENSEGGINGQIDNVTENVQGLTNLIKDVLSTKASNDAQEQADKAEQAKDDELEEA